MPNSKAAATMRVAIAGTNRLAMFIAHYVREDTSHQLLILSRSARPELTAGGYQVQVVNYGDASSLQHALMGVDTVISTVTGDDQLKLIEAAVQKRVRRFAPAEFEGRPSFRPAPDPLDRGRSSALALLQCYKDYIQSTVFVCGILYERLAPGGMAANGIGARSGIGNEGDFIIDIRNMRAQAPVYGPTGNLATLCLTAAQDVAKFVVRALDLPSWPSEMTMCGERMTVQQLINLAQQIKGCQLTSVEWHNPNSLRSELMLARTQNDSAKQLRLYSLIATAEGRYDLHTPCYLNLAFPDIHVLRLTDYLKRVWTGGA